MVITTVWGLGHGVSKTFLTIAKMYSSCRSQYKYKLFRNLQLTVDISSLYIYITYYIPFLVPAKGEHHIFLTSALNFYNVCTMHDYCSIYQNNKHFKIGCMSRMSPTIVYPHLLLTFIRFCVLIYLLIK